MALGDSYATATELRAYVGIPDAGDDPRLTSVLSAVSRWIETHCQRQFNDAGSASARSYYPATAYRTDVADFHTTTGLIVKTDEGDDGTYETTWAATDYQLEPLDGVVGGQTGWPFDTIRAVESRTFPCGLRPLVQITARWGWASVPADVKEGCLLQSSRVFERRKSPAGVAGFGDFGAVRVARLDPDVIELIEPFRKHRVLVA